MGRPLSKDILGTNAIGSYAGESTSIRVQIFDTQLRNDGVIIKQRGAKTFTCSRLSEINTGTAYRKYVLKNAEPALPGQMSMRGYLDAGLEDPIYVRKITKRVVTDFNNKRYTWRLIEDDNNDHILLTEINGVGNLDNNTDPELDQEIPDDEDDNDLEIDQEPEFIEDLESDQEPEPEED